MSSKPRFFKILKIVSICLLCLTGVNANIAGVLFIIDPTGAKMGMTTQYLSNSPFSNFLIPGITLLIVNGLMNMMSAIASLKNYTKYPQLIIMQGVLLSGWILIQVMMVRDFNLLHFVMLTIGLILLFSGIYLSKYHKLMRSNHLK